VRRAICVDDCKSGVGAIGSRKLGLDTRLEIRGAEGPAFAQFGKLLPALAEVRFRLVLELTHLAAPARCRTSEGRALLQQGAGLQPWRTVFRRQQREPALAKIQRTPPV
jgi:hypothetical protein